MAFCSKCGSEIPEGVVFCPKCGAPLAAGAVPYAASPYDHTAEFDKKDISDNKVLAMGCYVFSFLGILLAVIAAKDSDYCKFHAREALKIAIMQAISCFIMIIPVLGWIVGGVCLVILFVVIIIQFFNVCGNKAVESPIVRSFGFLK